MHVLLIICLLLMTGCFHSSDQDFSAPVNSCPPSIMVDGKLYYGFEYGDPPEKPERIGEITSSIDDTEMPTHDDEANCAKVGEEYLVYQGEVYMRVQYAWRVFRLSEEYEE